MRHTIYSLVDDSFVYQRAQSARLTYIHDTALVFVKTVEYRNIFCVSTYKVEASLKLINAQHGM